MTSNIVVNSGLSEEDADKAVSDAKAQKGFVSATKTWDKPSKSWVVTTVIRSH